MRELINHLEDMELTLKNMRDYLRGEALPSRSLTHTANDLIVSLGMTIHSAETLRRVLEPLEQAKGEVKEMIKEEEGGEDTGEQVSEPEGGEVRPETPPQEPEAGAPKGRKRVRD
uniref:Uncharacterized protein n=1 Tax=viral metagenome TaxID=1070528 RepID=A0A6H1ZV04_9ZZZZ